jgi:pimeloyl-ACP methyl ester carboxylesterase
MNEVALLDASGVTACDLPSEGWGDWLLTQLGSTLDATVLRAMRLVIDATLMPRAEQLPEMHASAAPFLSGELWEEPRRFFAFVDAPLTPVYVRGRRRRRLDGGVVVARELFTAYRPHPGLEAFVEAPAPDDRIFLEQWTHDGQAPRATVLALHGFSMGYPRLDAAVLFAAACFRAGYDVALLTLPGHGARTPRGARFSGERFAVPHVARLNEAVRQSVYEIHLTARWLRQQTHKPVGLIGLSLGGYLASLLAGLTPDLDFVVPIVPPVCMGDLAWRFFAQSRHYQQNRAAAFSREELRAAYRVHSPLTYAPRIDTARAFIVAGRGDQIVPPDHPHALWRHWGKPDIHWFSGSHLAPFRRSRLLALILEHLAACVKATA